MAKSRKIGISIDQSQFALQVRQAVDRAKTEFSKGSVGAAFMAGAIQSSQRGFQQINSSSRTFAVNIMASGISSRRAMEGIRAKAGEAAKGVLHLSEGFNTVMEAAHNITKLGATFTALKQKIGQAYSVVRKFVAANKVKIAITVAGLAGAIAGYKALQAALRGVRSAARAARNALGGIKDRIGSIFGAVLSNPFIPLMVGATALAGVMGILASAIQKSADLETFQTSFEVLLGGVDKAEKRMKELVNFANNTPFQLPEVAAASRSLEVMTHGALSTGKGLSLVGDLASGTNTKFEETAVTVGRLYDAIRSGRSAGESLMRLQEIGGLSGTGRNQIEGLITAGRTVDAWKLAEKELGRFGGMMTRQSMTWNGLMSTLEDSISEVQRQFSKPFMDKGKAGLMGKINLLNDLAPQAAALGTFIAEKLEAAGNVLVGAIANSGEAIEPLGDMMKGMFLSAGNVLLATMKAAITVVAGGGFFTSLKDGFKGLSMVIAGYLMSAFNKPMAYLKAGIESTLAHIPEALGGSGESKRHDEALDKANEAWGKEREAKMSGDTKVAARWDQEKKFQLKQAELNDPSFDAKFKRITTDGEVSKDAAEQVSAGKKLIASATENVFRNVADGLKSFNVEDVFDAKKFIDQGKEGLAKLAKEGEEITRAHAHLQHFEVDGMGRVNGQFRATLMGDHHALKGATMASTGVFSASGFHAAAVTNMQLATRTASILGVKERRAIEDDRVAQLAGQGIKGQRRGEGGTSGFGAVRRGDFKRAREVAKEKLREKMGLDKTNSILEAIQKRFDEMTK